MKRFLFEGNSRNLFPYSLLHPVKQEHVLQISICGRGNQKSFYLPSGLQDSGALRVTYVYLMACCSFGCRNT